VSVAIVHSRALSGVSAPRVSVEVHLAGGLPGVHIVGLAETEVREARDRVRAALQNAQFEFPARKVTISLAPADLPKESGRFDLPIAVGILVASGQLPHDKLATHEFAGELALTGELRAIRGALAMVLSARHDVRRQRRQRRGSGEMRGYGEQRRCRQNERVLHHRCFAGVRMRQHECAAVVSRG
jgi:magnesium chelatase family protein